MLQMTASLYTLFYFLVYMDGVYVTVRISKTDGRAHTTSLRGYHKWLHVALLIVNVFFLSFL